MPVFGGTELWHDWLRISWSLLGNAKMQVIFVGPSLV